MDCAGIQELISEYIDGALDSKNTETVEEHIATCEDCKEAFVSLSAMVEEMNALEPVKPPADFLEKIHQRMEPRSNVSRLFRKLFVPFKIKIPLQLAAAVTASVLVVMVLNLQKSEYQKMQPLKASKSERFIEGLKSNNLTSGFKTKSKSTSPVLEEVPKRLSDSEQGMPTQRSRVKSLAPPSIQRESEPTAPVLTKVRPSVEKGQPIELALVLKPTSMGTGNESDMAMQTTSLHENDKKAIQKKRSDKDTFGRKFETGQKSRIEHLILRINHIIRTLKGNILTKEYHKQSGLLKSIHVRIPAKNYVSFCRELNGLASFKTPPPTLSDESRESVKLFINFTYPE